MEGTPAGLRRENKNHGGHGCRHQHGHAFSHTHGYTHIRDAWRTIARNGPICWPAFVSYLVSCSPPLLVRCHYKFITSFNQPHRTPLLANVWPLFLNSIASFHILTHPRCPNLSETVTPYSHQSSKKWISSKRPKPSASSALWFQLPSTPHQQKHNTEWSAWRGEVAQEGVNHLSDSRPL